MSKVWIGPLAFLITLSFGASVCSQDLSVTIARQAAPVAPKTNSEKLRALTYLVRHESDFAHTRKDALSWPEYLDYSWAEYLIFDADGDGKISLSEFIQMRCSAIPYGKSSCDYDGRRAQVISDFRILDKDGKEYIIKSDIVDQALRWFRANDRNGTGFVPVNGGKARF